MSSRPSCFDPARGFVHSHQRFVPLSQASGGSNAAAPQWAWEEASNFDVRVSEFVRIGLTREQVNDLDSARLREGIAVKPSDSRAKRYI